MKGMPRERGVCVCVCVCVCARVCVFYKLTVCVLDEQLISVLNRFSLFKFFGLVAS